LKKAVRVLGSDGASILPEEVDVCALGASTTLPYEMERYFVTDASAVLVPLVSLILTRVRPRGVGSAGALMLAAYRGEHPRRAPVSVRQYGASAFLVQDGNSTVLNAIASDWPCILCRVTPI